MFRQWKCLWMDLRLYALRLGKKNPLWVFLMPVIYPQTWVNISYRVTRFVAHDLKVPIIKQILFLICFFVGRVNKMLTGIEVYHSADVGPGLYFAHTGSIIVAMKVKIGHSCSIHQEVTIGGVGVDNETNGFPCIGNGVYIGAGAKILGGVHVGNGALVGANAVVIKDVPAHTTVGGVPAHVISQHGSEHALMVYPGLEVE